MTQFNTIIRGGRISTASDTFHCDIGIKDGRIVALGEQLGSAANVIDAAGKWVLPGGIDSHVHVSQPSGDGIVMADDFDAIVCTNMRGPLIAPELEQELGIPILDSVAFTLWGCLDATGVDMLPLRKFGRMFACRPAPLSASA